MLKSARLRALSRNWAWRGIIRLESDGRRKPVSVAIVGDALRRLTFRRERDGVRVQLSSTHAILSTWSTWRNDEIPPTISVPGGGAIRVSVRASVAQEAEVSVLLRLVGEHGEDLGHVTLPVSDSRDWFLKVPHKGRRIVIALRLGSDGLVRPFALSFYSASPDVVATFGLQPEQRLALSPFNPTVEARTLLNNRRYDALLDFQKASWLQIDGVNHAAFSALVQLRLFKKALSFHRQWAPQGLKAASWERLRLEAWGNLGRWRAIRRMVRSSLRDMTDPGRPLKLLKAFPFVMGQPCLRSEVLQALDAVADQLPPGDPSAIDAANRALFLQPEPGRLLRRVLNDELQKPEDRLMLEGQAALRAGDAARHLSKINEVLALHGLAPIRVEGPLAISQISSVPTQSATGPKVSVIMTAFNSAETIGYAIRSIGAQTYQNLEIILVDDASSDNTVEVAREAAGGRVFRLSRQADNRGTYACRNIGLTMAKGRFVVHHDSDDWAHPQKIERLVETILAAEGRVAAWSKALRLSPDRGFTTRGGFLTMEGPSLMFEQADVLAAIGPFESVRAGGDGEFQRRLEQHFGIQNIGVCHAPLAIMAVRGASLSRSGQFTIDEGTGIFSAKRNAYRREYLGRHASRFQPPVAS